VLATRASSYELVVTQNVTFTLGSVSEGGLQITMPPTDANQISKVGYQQNKTNDEVHVGLPDIRDKAVKDIDFSKITEPLLEERLDLFCPRGGEAFFYKNPIPNNNRDILVEATYMGV